MSTSSISSIIRLSGMNSGLDTDSIVKSLMSIERLKVDRVYREKTGLEWKMDARTQVSSAISAFRSSTMSVLSENNLYTTAAFNTYQVNMATSTSSVSISATADASENAWTINSITRIASAASTSSSAAISADTLSLGTTLAELSLSTPLTFGGDNSDEIAFSINDQSFTFKATDTLRTVINTINASDAGVTLSYSELSGKLSLKTKTTGASSAINIVNTTGNAFGADSAFKIAEGIITNGQDALLSINGYAVTRSTNTFTIDGVSYNLKAASATSISFSVERDIDTTVDKIKNFVSSYNDLVNYLQTLIKEKKDDDYYPLTQAEKDEMSETEITSWENKAKAGVLYNDRNIADLLTTMRRNLYNTVEGTGLSLSSIGLKTGYYYEGGKISIDETALRDALTSRPEDVMNLFTQAAGDGKGAGFLPQLSDALTVYTKTFSATTAKLEISTLNTRISDLEDLLADRETALYKRYSAMETTLTTLNSQSSWLSSQFS